MSGESAKKVADVKLTLDPDNKIALATVFVPPGKFLMGLESSKRLPDDPQQPQKEVAIAKGFYLGKYEVTQGQFATFLAATGRKMPNLNPGWNDNLRRHDFGNYSWNKPGFPVTDEHPVVNVAFKDAAAFCDWLSGKAGRVVRLPFEKEWEYACRAGTVTRFHTGDEAASLLGNANVGDKSLKAKDRLLLEHGGWDDGFPFTAPVGSFKPNAWGLHDMHGNVSEWCQDPLPPNSGAERRIVRGGGWGSAPLNCRSGRTWPTTATASPSTGFRVLVEAD